MRFDRPVLMWVTDHRNSDATLAELAQRSLGAGIDLIQIREPDLEPTSIEKTIRAIRGMVDPATNIVVNSDIELARKLGVGVHLRENGPSVAEAREELGSSALIGRSIHSTESALASNGASYLVAGHVFPTGSKQGLPPLGLVRLLQVVRVAPAPVLAIGGITPERVSDILTTGCAGIAVMSPFTRVETIHQRATEYRIALEQSMNQHMNQMITATINGKQTSLPAGTTLSSFLAGRELHERLVVIERNGEIVKRARFSDTVIEQGDLLEIVHFVGGGII